MVMLRKIFLYIKKRFLFEEPLFVLFSFSEERNDAHNIISNPVILSEAKNLIKNMSSPRRGRKYPTIHPNLSFQDVKNFSNSKIFFYRI